MQSDGAAITAPTAELLYRVESIIRCKMLRCPAFTPEHLRIMDYFLDRSVLRGRIAMYFRSWRKLGKATDNSTHAQELIKGSKRKTGLLELKVIAPVVLANAPAEGVAPSTWHWYRWNLNFLEWPEEKRVSGLVWEDPPLPFEAELADLVHQATAEELQRFSAGSATSAAELATRGRDAVPAQLPIADTNAGQSQSAPRSDVNDDSAGASAAQSKPDREVTAEDWARLKRDLAEGKLGRDYPAKAVVASQPSGVPHQGTVGPGPGPSVPCQGTKSVPSQGTVAYPNSQCTLPGYTEKTNKDGPKGVGVPWQGTYPYKASSASVQKAELAKLFNAVPQQGTESFNEKVALALAWIARVDLSGGLGVERFRNQFERLCRKHPDYVLVTCPYILKRQLELHGDVPKPLALLAKVARADKKMEGWQ